MNKGYFFSYNAIGILLTLFHLATVDDAPPVADVTQGQLKGKWFTTRGGRRIAGFLGIPYAVPPIGILRFRSPLPAPSWGDDVYDATEAGAGCLQHSSPFVPTISEDCLYLNVYTPNVNPTDTYPVLVFIHGGSFEGGSGGPLFYGPDYLLDEDIILVTINYRLGILGFLSLEHPVLPGNLGLKDQRAALRWVRLNIARFGGDPDKVTLFGESAGAAAASFHHIFTATEGLFRAVILNSKSAMSVSSFQPPGAQRPLVDIVAKETKCPRQPEDLVQCLRRLPAEDFVTVLMKIKTYPSPVIRKMTVFCPVVEPACVSNKVVTGDPFQKITRLPLLIGNNQLEGLINVDYLTKGDTEKVFQELNDKFETIIPINLQFEDFTLDPRAVARSLKKFYFADQPLDVDNFLHLADMYSDAHYNYGNVLAARANKANTFFYQLNYKGANSIEHISIGNRAYDGVSHGDDLFYLFPMGGIAVKNRTDADIAISETMVKMWTNFVKYLNPTPDDSTVLWKPVTSPQFEYLNIGQTSIAMDKDFIKERTLFWDNLPYRNKPTKRVADFPDSRFCRIAGDKTQDTDV